MGHSKRKRYINRKRNVQQYTHSTYSNDCRTHKFIKKTMVEIQHIFIASIFHHDSTEIERKSHTNIPMRRGIVRARRRKRVLHEPNSPNGNHND